MNYFIFACGALLLIQILAALIWFAAYRIEKTSLIDTFWSLLIFSGVVLYFIVSGNRALLAQTVLFLSGAWALRLACHIALRARGHGEDPRYQALRLRWGKEEKKKMLIFYFQQGCAAWIFTFPFLILFLDPSVSWSFWHSIGSVIWFIAFMGETVSDYQLWSFKKNPQNKGSVCRVGFWKYSRHPNYFFEWLNWVAFAWLAWLSDGGWVALLCPALIYYFLNHVSGIPLAEKQALQSRSADYQEYQKKTSPFFLWPPKRQDGI